MKDIRVALVRRILMYNRQPLLTITECEKEGDNVLVRGKDSDWTVVLAMNIAEALATTGKYEWWGEFRFGPLCKCSGTQVLKVVKPVSRKRRPPKQLPHDD